MAWFSDSVILQPEPHPAIEQAWTQSLTAQIASEQVHVRSEGSKREQEATRTLTEVARVEGKGW